MREREEALRHQALQAQDRERLNLAMELHDGLIQEIVAARMMLEFPDLPTNKVQESLDNAVRRCRAVMVRLHPEALTTSSLLDLLRDEATAVNPHARFQAQLPPQLEQRCPTTVEALARIALELLANVRRHASRALEELSVTTADDAVVLTVVDSGPGGAPRQSPHGHFGLSSVHHRAESLGGTVQVVSRPGEGTRVIVRLPLPAAPRTTQ